MTMVIIMTGKCDNDHDNYYDETLTVETITQMGIIMVKNNYPYYHVYLHYFDDYHSASSSLSHLMLFWSVHPTLHFFL